MASIPKLRRSEIIDPRKARRSLEAWNLAVSSTQKGRLCPHFLGSCRTPCVVESSFSSSTHNKRRWQLTQEIHSPLHTSGGELQRGRVQMQIHVRAGIVPKPSLKHQIRVSRSISSSGSEFVKRIESAESLPFTSGETGRNEKHYSGE